MYAFADAFDHAFTLKYDLESLLKQRIPLSLFTDSRSLFDVIKKSSSTSEKRLMIDITSVRKAYENQEISDVGFVRSNHNPADALTKTSKCKALDTIIHTGKCDE